jgi:glyoxylase-like metal-dependent hydrolase (beta-lactamase superfamily II)
MPGQPAHITTLDHGLMAIDTEYARPLQDASHLIIEGGRGAFVDTGVNSSVPLLLAALRQSDLDPGDVDFVFLTHIHLDHAGGAGQLMQQLPNARCILHPRGAPHMVDPTRLVAGTEAVYGKERTQQQYGTIQAIDADRIDIAEDGEHFSLHGRELQAFYTEGHARHHYCLSDPASKGVFTGDSFGVSYRELDTAAGEFIFPTSTPIHFDPDEAHKSVDRIMSYDPERLYLTHYSQVGNLDRLATDMHKGIKAFVTMALENASAQDRTAALQAAMFEYFVAGLIRHGFKGDRDAVRAILNFDVALNVQGLEVWLDKTNRGQSPKGL